MNSIDSIYSQVKSFDELCAIGCKFIKGEIKTHPFLITINSQDNLYELTGEYEWIKKYLFQYNKLGFYTIMSQPGTTKPTDIYANYYEYKKSFSTRDKQIYNNVNSNKLAGTYGIKQRAEVEGFMRYSNALELYSMLKNDPNVIILIKIKKDNLIDCDYLTNNTFNDALDKYATLSYEQIDDLNNKIRFMIMEDETNIMIKKKYFNYKRNDKLKLMYHLTKRYFEINKYDINKHLPNIMDLDIVSISIMDKRFDSNDYLWDKILFCLKQINKIN